MSFHVYIIRCEGGSFYTGYCQNVKSRMKLHTKGKGARYTRKHRPEELVYVEDFDSRSEAMKREKKIKTLNHRQKLKLIKSKVKSKSHNPYLRAWKRSRHKQP